MSYDYDGLVAEIAVSRKRVGEAEKELETLPQDADETTRSAKELELLEHLSASIDRFESLSKHCPMTPLLWMQYASDTYELMKAIKRQEDPQIFSEPGGNVALREALEPRIQLLELAVHEFPGSAMLRLHHAEMVQGLAILRYQDESDDWENARESYPKLLDDALEQVGRGSHRNEGRVVVRLYTMRCNHILTHIEHTALEKELSRLFVRRAGTPMNDGINAGLGDQYEKVAYSGGIEKVAQAATLAKIEERRRFEAKHYGFLVTYEDDIDVALSNEAGVSNAEGIETWANAEAEEANEQGLSYISRKWKTILNAMDKAMSGCWMGLGGPQTANAYIQYAQACFRYRCRDEHMDESDAKGLEQAIQNLAVSVFERGVAECPTVDTLWLSYLRRLNYLIDNPINELSQKRELLTRAAGVADRAIRNCPYSVDLVKSKLKVVLAMANSNMLVLDPEELMTKLIVRDSLENGFLQPSEGASPSAAIELFRSLLETVRKRILFVLAEIAQTAFTTKNGKKSVTTILQYDDPESIQPILSQPTSQVSSSDDSLGDEVLQDLEDLCNDLREIYDEADSYLRKNNKRYKSDAFTAATITVEEGRAALARDRAMTESHLVAPLLRAIELAISDTVELESAGASARAKEDLAEILKHHDRVAKIWQPPHPGTYQSYIDALSASSAIVSATLFSPLDVLFNLRRLRFLYQKALKSVGNARAKTQKNKNQPAATEPDPTTLSTNALFPDELDYETSLRCLCRNYLFFERIFGSERSYQECQKAVQRKLSKAYTAMATADNAALSTTRTNATEGDVCNDTTDTTLPMALEIENDRNAPPNSTTQKRKRDNGDESKDLDPPNKRSKEVEEKGDVTESEPAPPKKPTNFQELEEQKLGHKLYPKHKIKVGKLEYPAHPFTVKVSFLSPETEDMDLVDALRPKCGPIVHARVVRNKHTHKSKGQALVQFEERESVETALGLSDLLGIGGKSVIIKRSHLPAIGIVPSGMHRVNPKGEGKSTNRNQHLRNRKKPRAHDDGPPPTRATKPSPQSAESASAESKPPATSKPAKPTTSIFAFAPRGVAKGGGGAPKQRKAKISISSSSSDAKK
jgi:RNA recognition motif-containing protein